MRLPRRFRKVCKRDTVGYAPRKDGKAKRFTWED